MLTIMARSKWNSEPWATTTSCSGGRGVSGVPAFSPALHKEHRPAQEPSAPGRANAGHLFGAATLSNFMAVDGGSKAKPCSLLLSRSDRAATSVRPEGEGPSPAAAVPPLNKGRWPARGSVSAVCAATLGLPRTGRHSRMLLWMEPSSSFRRMPPSGSTAWRSTAWRWRPSHPRSRAQLSARQRLAVRGVRGRQPHGQRLLLGKPAPHTPGTLVARSSRSQF